MAQSKGPSAADGGGKEGFKARGHSPSGQPGHGGHHRKHFDEIPVNPGMDAGRNNPAARANVSGGPAPMGNVGQ